MGYIDLSPSPQSSYTQKVFEGKYTLRIGKKGKIFRFPIGAGKISHVSITIIANSGSGYAKYTTSPRHEIRDRNALFENCSLGVVTNTSKTAILGPITGIRLIRISGTVTIEVKAE